MGFCGVMVISDPTVCDVCVFDAMVFGTYWRSCGIVTVRHKLSM